MWSVAGIEVRREANESPAGCLFGRRGSAWNGLQPNDPEAHINLGTALAKKVTWTEPSPSSARPCA